MIKTVLIALIYFLIGLGIANSCKSDKKDDIGFIIFVLLFWPVVVGLLLLILAIVLIIAGIEAFNDKWRGE